MSDTPPRRCAATFEQVAAKDRDRTHTCGLPAGHDGDEHSCPRCGKRWTKRRRAAYERARR